MRKYQPKPDGNHGYQPVNNSTTPPAPPTSGSNLTPSITKSERVYEKCLEDNGIWFLLQEVVAMHQDLEKCKKDIETIGEAISPILMAEAICRCVRRNEYE